MSKKIHVIPSTVDTSSTSIKKRQQPVPPSDSGLPKDSVFTTAKGFYDKAANQVDKNDLDSTAFNVNDVKRLDEAAMKDCKNPTPTKDENGEIETICADGTTIKYTNDDYQKASFGYKTAKGSIYLNTDSLKPKGKVEAENPTSDDSNDINYASEDLDMFYKKNDGAHVHLSYTNHNGEKNCDYNEE